MFSIIDNGSDNDVVVDDVCQQRLNGELRINGDGNYIRITRITHMPADAIHNKLNLNVSGSRVRCELMALGSINSLNILMTNDTVLHIGEGSTFNFGSRILMHEPSQVRVGKDCMFGGESRVQTSDMHGLYDYKTGIRLNLARDVEIGDHVWLGNQACVLKGVSIGAHAIVAQRATVTKDVPARSCVAGTPARVIRTGVTWSRWLTTSIEPHPESY